jgi:predicted HAD superfamily Cof-like phosphohydrolase
MSAGCEVEGGACVDGGLEASCSGRCSDERRRVNSAIKEAMRVTGLSRDEVMSRLNGLATIIFDAADMLREKFTPTAISNLFTMTASGEVKPEVALPEVPSIPPFGVRMLRARLILEESLETINALGFKIKPTETGFYNEIRSMDDLRLVSHGDAPDLEGIIDGCCDVIYVATGTLLACGVPDVPHLDIVNRANNAKFPGGVATLNEYGKFQKPAGWEPPDHMTLINDAPSEKLVNVRAAGQLVVAFEKHAAEKSAAEKSAASPS